MNATIKEINAVKEEAIGAADAVLDKGAGVLGSFLDDVESALDRARKATGRGVRQAANSTAYVARTTDGYVRGNPWVAIGIAVAAGLAVGTLLKRRR